jgi:hypothetical protein
MSYYYQKNLSSILEEDEERRKLRIEFEKYTKEWLEGCKKNKKVKIIEPEKPKTIEVTEQKITEVQENKVQTTLKEIESCLEDNDFLASLPSSSSSSDLPISNQNQIIDIIEQKLFEHQEQEEKKDSANDIAPQSPKKTEQLEPITVKRTTPEKTSQSNKLSAVKRRRKQQITGPSQQ